MGDDLTVVNAARVSFDKLSTNLSNKDKKLISYLAKHKHMSPFGHCFATFLVSAPVFVARQLVKHKFLRWNEVSRRYVDKDPEFYIPEEWRTRPEGNIKQGSGEGTVDYEIGGTMQFVRETYNNLLKEGVAPEQARMVLPQNTMTEWYWSGSLDAFADMCNLRLKEDAQHESKLVAKEISFVMDSLYPVSWKELMNGR